MATIFLIPYTKDMIIDGKRIAQEVEQEIKAEVDAMVGRKPCLAVVLVGENPASQIYVGRKRKACERVGIRSLIINLPETISENKLLDQIESLNNDVTVDGILVQLPLPKQISESAVTLKISPSKDVDGFHPMNVGKLLNGDTDGFFPCTPFGIMRLLEKCHLETDGKHVVIIGRSNIVGKPMASLLIQKNANATVTVVHSKTKNLPQLCQTADIIIAAIGRANFLTKEMVKENAVVIDVGINRVDDPSAKSGYRIVGDADIKGLKDHCRAITPVPGGVGPMTIVMLLQNTLKARRLVV